ncbi:hypothetical protein CYMTET_48031 [Cymbomonas tetramitiformis]|uniref:Uncharacterized protein n=1 Tax=Cymbomonas tetramitiformis TaxID=36881 RepID=A0AAE0EW16_9CHLO|nr:hypothetical protein CYMTET_48031 [Cymbomonas tetramitiformis]
MQNVTHAPFPPEELGKLESRALSSFVTHTWTPYCEERSASIPDKKERVLNYKLTNIWLAPNGRVTQIDLAFKKRLLAPVVLFNSIFRVPTMYVLEDTVATGERLIPNIYVWSWWAPTLWPAKEQTILLASPTFSGMSVTDVAAAFKGAMAKEGWRGENCITRIKKGVRNETPSAASLREVVILETVTPGHAACISEDKSLDLGFQYKKFFLPSAAELEEAGKREIAIIDYSQQIFMGRRAKLGPKRTQDRAPSSTPPPAIQKTVEQATERAIKRVEETTKVKINVVVSTLETFEVTFGQRHKEITMGISCFHNTYKETGAAMVTTPHSAHGQAHEGPHRRQKIPAPPQTVAGEGRTDRRDLHHHQRPEEPFRIPKAARAAGREPPAKKKKGTNGESQEGPTGAAPPPETRQLVVATRRTTRRSRQEREEQLDLD